MTFSAEEKLMYRVMRAIYESGIPIDFKGSMVLKACLAEAGYYEDIRHTVDIDANWYSDTLPTIDQMIESLENALVNHGIDLGVRNYRMYGDTRSAGFELTDLTLNEPVFTMDIDVNRPIQTTKLYQIEEIRFRGITPNQMMADKISVISTNKVFRRIKDVIDIFYLSHVFELNAGELLKTMELNGRSLGDFDGFLHNPQELQHAYEKFRLTGDVTKPAFDELYSKVKTFIGDILPLE